MSMKTSDLNMLVALNALIEERSVTGATRRLHLSSPVMSRPLARLRETLDDPILVRAYRSMVPTPKALQMQEQVRGIVELAEGYFAQRQGFDLDRLSRTFK
ncbi:MULTISPECIES: LysR family transcriptional regulator [Pseudomonas]|jgi:DNA-binding transcriptional LysR family regulator|uniref:TodR n=4 Tax=Pseudomonas putida group TaxID=136845 RepID=Q51970_PSEPU|nr:MULTISPECIES: LysR family transcriptional regulator [Pseudomonas]AAC43317.1 TodR [Pseudomonas putida]ABA10806.1 truncated LysR-type regulator [Pseudomonas putida]AFO50090.1 LysR family transcriptional regulator [Pseudomonas putida DOT-T1E]AHC82455.1 LysR family transcriptional regulator [Pseudomonas monteilii SB3078]AHC87833.1 LysR family transcriptional regulator [Pseudomonas monteilii SB3101]